MVMSLTDPLLQPLFDEEFEKLENFLASDSTPEDALFSIEMVDGYMTALVVGPEVISPDRWISFIWDQENDDEPCYDSEAEAISIRALLLRHMNTIALQFESNPDEFFPLFEQFSYADEEEKRVAVENWALGFTLGMELAHTSWQPFLEDEETAQLVLPIFILAKITDDFDDLTEEDLYNLTLMMPEFIIKIYDYWNEA
jgi:uncharacterized protein